MLSSHRLVEAVGAKSPTFFVSGGRDFSLADNALVDFIYEYAREHKTTARICLHSSSQSDLHNMLIAHFRGNYIKPHKNPYKSKAYHILKGEMRIVGLDDGGNSKFDIVLSMNGEVVCRIDKGIYLLLLPVSEVVVFHEIALGPFVVGEQVYAPYAPEVGDKVGIAEFIDKYKKEGHVKEN